MKNFLTKTTALTAGIIFSVLWFFTETFALPAQEKKWLEQFWKEWVTLDQMVLTFIGWVFTFLMIIAVVIFLIAWFMIMTAWGDDDKVKKGKTWMINAVIWIVVIFLARSVVEWIFKFLSDQGE